MRPTRSFLLAIILGAAALVVLASPVIGDSWGPTAPAERVAAAKATKLKLENSQYGRVLFANGFAQYVFTKDEGRRSRCYGECAEAWPPLRAQGEIVTGAGIDEGLVGKTRRRDGSKQLTYAGQPLYGYVHDPRGQVLCHDVVEFGGTWLAVRGSGRPAP